MYHNISNSSTATSQNQPMKHENRTFENHMLQQPKNLIATFKNHLLQRKKPIATRRNSKNVQTIRGWVRGTGCSNLGPSPSSSPERRGKRTLELAGTP
jgi:hypothetical protein